MVAAAAAASVMAACAACFVSCVTPWTSWQGLPCCPRSRRPHLCWRGSAVAARIVKVPHLGPRCVRACVEG